MGLILSARCCLFAVFPSPRLAQQKYNDPSQDKIGEAHRKVADVKSIMIENIDKVLLRGEKMEILVDRASCLVLENCPASQHHHQMPQAHCCRLYDLQIQTIKGPISETQP